MKWVVAVALVEAICFAGGTGRPACSAQNQGRLWPEEANLNRKTAKELYRLGDLEMCSLIVWKYRWERISVNIRTLETNKRQRDSKVSPANQRTDDARHTSAANSSQ